MDLAFVLQPSAWLCSKPVKTLLCLDFTSAPLLSKQGYPVVTALCALAEMVHSPSASLLCREWVSELDSVRLKVCLFALKFA